MRCWCRSKKQSLNRRLRGLSLNTRRCSGRRTVLLRPKHREGQALALRGKSIRKKMFETAGRRTVLLRPEHREGQALALRYHGNYPPRRLRACPSTGCNLRPADGSRCGRSIARDRPSRYGGRALERKCLKPPAGGRFSCDRSIARDRPSRYGIMETTLPVG